jgi:hypothetical protein
VRHVLFRWDEPPADLAHAIAIGAFCGTIQTVPLLRARLGVTERTVGYL